MDIPWKSIIILIILILIIYFIWKMTSSSSSTSSGLQSAKTQTTLSGITTSTDLNFSISTWIEVDTWTNKSINKPIITTTKDGSSISATYNISVSLDKIMNNLIVLLTYPTGTSPLTITITQPNFPIQTWVSVILNIHNGTVLDLYINGKLVKTSPLTNIFVLPNMIYIGSVDGFEGSISNTTYTPNPIGPEDAWDTYSNGFDGSGGSSITNMFNKYKLRFAFVKDNTEVSRLDI